MPVTEFDYYTQEQRESYEAYLQWWYAEISDLAKSCISKVGMDGRQMLQKICLLIDMEPDTPAGNTIICIARAFLHTQGCRDATPFHFDIMFRHSGVIASWYDENEFMTITLRELIIKFYGETYMYDEYVRLFGPINDNEARQICNLIRQSDFNSVFNGEIQDYEQEYEQDNSQMNDVTELWILDQEPEPETNSIPNQEPFPEPDDEL